MNQMNAKSRHRQRRRLLASIERLSARLPSYRLERVRSTYGLLEQAMQACLEDRDRGRRHTFIHFYPYHVGGKPQ